MCVEKENDGAGPPATDGCRGGGLKCKMYLTESSLCNVPWNGLAGVRQ